MSNTPTPAALRLIIEGITGVELARALHVTPQAVSSQLAGKTAETSSELLDAITERGGPELAAEVAELIEAERLRRTA